MVEFGSGAPVTEQAIKTETSKLTRVWRGAAVVVVGLGLTGTLAEPASAAKPNTQACLGEQISGETDLLHPFGQALKPFAVSGLIDDQIQYFLENCE